MTSREKHYIERHANKVLRKRIAWKKWLKKKNLRKYKGNKKDRMYERLISGLKSVRVPGVFSFIENPEEVIRFINNLKVYLKERTKVFVNLKKVEEIDYGAITTLLAVMYDFKSNKVYFNGNLPKNKRIKKLIEDSGFFIQLDKPKSEGIQYTIGKQNQMFTKANKVVVSELGRPIMEDTSKTVWGEPKIYKGLQRVLVELMQNTNNHADLNDKGKERWWLSVNHDIESKKVSFVFVDYGVGVFESLKNKHKGSKWFNAVKIIIERIKYGKSHEVLKMLLEGDLHLTVTGEHFRGKGLPGIYEVLMRNQISNLFIITNTVFADVTNINYRELNNSFSGTFLCWEINQQNECLKWTIS